MNERLELRANRPGAPSDRETRLGDSRLESLVKHLGDPWPAHTPFEPCDDALVSNQEKRGDRRHAELLRERRHPTDVNALDPNTPALLVSELRDQTFPSAAPAPNGLP